MNNFFGRDVIHTSKFVEKKSRMKSVKIDKPSREDSNPLKKRIFQTKDAKKDSFGTYESKDSKEASFNSETPNKSNSTESVSLLDIVSLHQ